MEQKVQMHLASNSISMTDGNENYISSANDAYDEPIPDDDERESIAINKQELSPSKRTG